MGLNTVKALDLREGHLGWLGAWPAMPCWGEGDKIMNCWNVLKPADQGSTN